MRSLLLIPSLCLLSACGASINARPDLPPSLLVPCDHPVTLPDRALSDQEVEIYWGRDRSALRACASRHAGLIDAAQ